MERNVKYLFYMDSHSFKLWRLVYTIILYNGISAGSAIQCGFVHL